MFAIFPSSFRPTITRVIFHSFTNPLTYYHHHNNHNHRPITLLLCIIMYLHVSQRTLFGIIIIERLLNSLENQLWWLFAVHTAHQILLFIIINNWHCLRMENVEAFFQRINIIIGSSNTPAQASVNAYTIGTFKEQHKL